MSMLNRPGKGTDLGEVIASTKDYEAAQKIVSKLIAGEVPARDIAIVGEGVRTVERVTGKLGYAAAARSGATNGVLIGLLLSAVMLFGTPDAPISLFLGFLLIGVALGMIMSLVTYSIVRRRRDFASMTQMLADHYEVRVQPASLTKARGVVGPERSQTVRPPVDLSEPPRYGERVPSAGQGGSSAAGQGDSAGAAGHGDSDGPTDASGPGTPGGPVSPMPQPVADPAPAPAPDPAVPGSGPAPGSDPVPGPDPVPGSVPAPDPAPEPYPAPGTTGGPVVPPKPPLPGAEPGIDAPGGTADPAAGGPVPAPKPGVGSDLSTPTDPR